MNAPHRRANDHETSTLYVYVGDREEVWGLTKLFWAEAWQQRLADELVAGQLELVRA